jgi:DNA-binding transcriptional LysR family regulator
MKAKIAPSQYAITAQDLALVLALARGGTLALAGERLLVDASTVFRNLQRLERALGQSLFVRSRAGYAVSETAHTLVSAAERIESQLEGARAALQQTNTSLAGVVRITSTDSVLQGLVMPALHALHAANPQLRFELHTGSELVNLTQRDADIAVRATKSPPQHLIGKCVGRLNVAVYASRGLRVATLQQAMDRGLPWVAPDEGLPTHPSVLWRKRTFPKLVPSFSVFSIGAVLSGIEAKLGIGVLPTFLAQGRSDLQQLSSTLQDVDTELWVLTHSEARHLRRVSAVYNYLVSTLKLP